jgi:hypothetical protein
MPALARLTLLLLVNLGPLALWADDADDLRKKFLPADPTVRAEIKHAIENELPAKPDRNGIVAAATISAKRSHLNQR